MRSLQAYHTVRDRMALLVKGHHIAAIGILLAIFLPLAALFQPDVLEQANNQLYDVFVTRTASLPASDDLLIVDVDDRSLRRHGQWPWPRHMLADMVKRLSAAGVSAIVFDMVFPEVDRTSPHLVGSVLNRHPQMVEALEGVDLPDNDRLLAAAIRSETVVLAFQFRFDPAETKPSADCRLHPLIMQIPTTAADWDALVWKAEQVTCNLPILGAAADSSGFFNVSPDGDGVLRKVPLVMAFDGQYYPSLALAAAMKVLDRDRLRLDQTWGDRHLILGNRSIPIDLAGAMLVNYRRPIRVFEHISVTDIFSGTVSDAKLKGKIVFIGTSAAGLKDFASTPVDPLFPAIAVHATVVDNILGDDFLCRPFTAPVMEALAAFICGILLTFIHIRARVATNLFVNVAGALALVSASFMLFSRTGLFFSPILPLTVLVAVFTTINLLRFWNAEKRARRSVHDLSLAQSAIIESMAAMTETRDSDTGGHIKRTQEYVRLLADELRRNRQYGRELTDDEVDLLYRSAPLHDIGKVGISDRILRKKGKLSPDEFEEMKQHTIIGRHIIEATSHKLGRRSFLSIAHEIVRTHHEKWDGSGYPQGLKGDQIPLSGRLMALADTYDALISKRVYKPAFSHRHAVRVIQRESGRSFDPKIVAAFMRLTDAFLKVALTYTDCRTSHHHDQPDPAAAVDGSADFEAGHFSKDSG